MRIAVAGAGYVGLSLAILLAKKNEVLVVDICEEKVSQINSRISPIRDDYIEEYLKKTKLHLTATLDGADAYRNADIIIVATPTNYDDGKKYFDTTSVESVIEQIIAVNPSIPVVIKSTVPVGYTDLVIKKYRKENIFFCPEFLRESKALYDNLYPSRIIVGCLDKNKKDVKFFIELLLEAVQKKDVEVLYMGTTEAESVKLFSNAYLAMRVSFFNELDTYAEIKHLDSSKIIQGVCLDPRIGEFYNNPSFGYGGYCLPKDTKQLLSDYSDVPEKLISAIVESNSTRKNHIADSILQMMKNRGAGVVGVYRITMKSGSDNFRQSSVLDVLKALQARGVPIVIYEPILNELDSFMGIDVIHDLNKFKTICDVIVANRYDKSLADIKNCVYTRDLFGRD